MPPIDRERSHVGVNGFQGEQQCVSDPPDASVPVSRPPAASQDGEVSGGDGGCTATALSAIGVFSSTEAAVDGLDAEIPHHHKKMCKERGQCEESEAGIYGEQWHPEVIKRAVVAAGCHCKSLPINPSQAGCVDLRTKLTKGSYLAVGVTNNQWWKGKTKQPLKYPDWPADAPANDTAGWVHSIAVVDGQVCDFQMRQPISALWLEKNNQPDPRKGYMRTIRKAWRLRKCTRPGTGCKGACHKAKPPGGGQLRKPLKPWEHSGNRGNTAENRGNDCFRHSKRT